MSPKISVVVPVFDPGPYIEPNIASLLGQSLSPTEYEVIYVDDGSTDGTGPRLDALADKHQHIRVIHIPNSGWPGRPRNIGIAESQGEYVQLVDQDDRLGPEALERLSTTGRRNGADIVIGKVTSDFRPVPHSVFRKNRAVCTINDAPLIESLTTHKCFRVAFLRDHGIKFPEGPWILEDQLFMVKAYLRAQVVSIVADYPSYYYLGRDDGGNAYTSRFNAGPYFANVGTIMDLVVAETEPGEVRDRLLRRLYRSEVIGRLTEPIYLQHLQDRREEIFDAAHLVAIERVPEQIHDSLTPISRARSALLRADRSEDLLEFARRLESIRASYRVTDVKWNRNKLRIAIRAGFFEPNGKPAMAILRRGDRAVLDPSLSPPGVDDIDVTDHLRSPRLAVSLCEPATFVEWIAPTRATVAFADAPVGSTDRGQAWPTLAARITVDIRRIASGGPLGPGRWDLKVQVFAFGLGRPAEARSRGSLRGPVGRLDKRGRVILATRDASGDLSLFVDADPVQLAATLRLRPLRIEPTDGRRLRVHVPVGCRSDATPRAVRFIVATPSTNDVLPAVLSPGGPRLDHLVASGRLDRSSLTSSPGPVSLKLRLGEDGSDVPIADATLDGSGRIDVHGVQRVSSTRLLLGDAVVRVKRLARAIRRRVRPGRRDRSRRAR